MMAATVDITCPHPECDHKAQISVELAVHHMSRSSKTGKLTCHIGVEDIDYRSLSQHITDNHK